ncbi:hypothetical protein B0H14DRAFT_3605207 [Mycena olivaceomarginata]|nr:hypothetical protein B0H14DRAFT_3605207 [Mycena olivaceomarginata]
MGCKPKNPIKETPPSVSRPAGRSKKGTNSEDIVEVIDSDSGGKESTKDRNSVISWANNPAWLSRAIEHLTTDSSFHLKLFSDSTEDANKEVRQKKASEGKQDQYDEATVSQEVQEDYAQNSSRYAKSLQQQFARLKKTYTSYVKTLYQTGGGLKPADQQSNLISEILAPIKTPLTARAEKIQQSFPHWDELHGFWCELPNYNPIGVSNATGGVHHSAKAEALFGRRARMWMQGNTSGIEDLPGWNEHASSRGQSASSVGDQEIDELSSDEEKPVVKPEKKTEKEKSSSRGKPAKPAVKPGDKASAKPGDKRTFDLTALDEAHCQDMADSARRQDARLALEAKRTDLQLEREKNKKRKLEFDAKRLRIEQEDRRERMRREEERNNRVFGLMLGMMGMGAGMGASVGRTLRALWDAGQLFVWEFSAVDE